MKSIFEYYYLSDHQGPKYAYVVIEHPEFKSNMEFNDWIIESGTNLRFMEQYDISMIIDFRLICNAQEYLIDSEMWDEVSIEDVFKIFLESQHRIDAVTYEQQYANIATALHDQLFDYNMSIIKIIEIVIKVTAMAYQITSKTMSQIIDYMNGSPKQELNS